MALGAGAFTAWITEKKKRKQEQTAQWHNKIKQETDSSPVSGQVRKEENIKKRSGNNPGRTEGRNQYYRRAFWNKEKRGGQSGGNLW